MGTRLVLQLVPLILLLVVPSEGLFFGSYPKKIVDLLHFLKGKHEAKKGHQTNNIHHYHVHYYPTPIHVYTEEGHRAPEKRHMDKYHEEELRSLGWSDYAYQYIPETKVTVGSSLDETWSSHHSSWGWDPDIIDQPY